MKSELDSHEAFRTYEEIPLLKPEDILPSSGFYSPNGSLVKASLPYFLNGIVDAFRDPGWLSIPYFDEIKRARTAPPASQEVTESQIAVLTEFQQKNRNDFYELAKQLNRGYTIPGMAPMAMADIVARAIEKTGQKNPNIMFFRGAEYDDELHSYGGYDFSPGDFLTAVNYTKSDINARPRTNPVIAWISFQQVGKLFSMNKLWIATEEEWWRGSLEIHFRDKEEQRNIVRIRRLPQKQSSLDQIIQRFTATAIPVYYILGE